MNAYVNVYYKGYSLPFEALFLVSGVFLTEKNLQLRNMYYMQIVLAYSILAVLFVRIDISSYLRWEVPILNEEGHSVSKTVKVSDHMLRMLIFGSALINLVGAEVIHFDPHLRSSSLNGIQWVFLALWTGAASVLSGLYIIMLGHTVTYHHSLVDAIATYIVLVGICAPLLFVIKDVVIGMILPRILGLLSYLVKSRGSNPNPVSSGSESKAKTD